MNQDRASDVTPAECVQFFHGGIYQNPNDLQPALTHALTRAGKDISDDRGYLELLRLGRDWVIAPLRDLQPHSYSAFMESVGPLQVGLHPLEEGFSPRALPSTIVVAFMSAGRRMIQVFPWRRDSTYEMGEDWFGSLRTLPDALAKSWLWRTGGWRVPSEPYESGLVNRRLIGHPCANWMETTKYLDTLGRGWKKKFLPRIVDIFPDIFVPANSPEDMDHYYFECFLDTRPSVVYGPAGDQFFVCTTRTDQIVYHIHHGDVANIRILHDPADAIDRYCAHVLRNLPGDFDFSPWSEPMG